MKSENSPMNMIEDGQGNTAVLLAHGAGAPMDSEFMNLLAERLAAIDDVTVIRFEFPYMAKRRADGKKRPPDRMPALIERFKVLVDEVSAKFDRVFVGGKSMGGRVASESSASLDVSGVICFGYPFHPPGKPEKTRLQNFVDSGKTTLVLQGTRDPFGKPEEISDYTLPENVQVAYIEDGNHDLKPRKASGRDWLQNLDDAVTEVEGFLGKLQAKV